MIRWWSKPEVKMFYLKNTNKKTLNTNKHTKRVYKFPRFK
jgi:hypothetical protein